MTYTQWKQQRLKGSTPQAVGQIATVSTSKDPAEQSMTYSQWMKRHGNTETSLSRDNTATEDTRTQRQKELDRLSAVANPESASYDPDFISKASYVSTKINQNNPSYFDVPTRDFYSGTAGEMDTGYSDITYEFINGNEDISELIVGLGHNYSQIYENEKRLYNYYHTIDRENGTNIANDYLELIQEDLNKRAAGDEFEEYEGNTPKELAFAAKSGVHNYGVSTDNWYRQKDGYIAPTETQLLSEMIREDLADDSIPMWYNAKTGKWEKQILGRSAGQLLYDVIETTANTAPSLLVSYAVGLMNPVLGQIAAGAMQYGSSGGTEYTQKINEGYTQEQANTYGNLVAVAESTIDLLWGKIGNMGGEAVKTLTKNLGKVDDVFTKVATSRIGRTVLNGLEEGSEEMLQSFLIPYLEQALTGEEVTHDWQESLYSGLLGFLTGSLSEATSHSNTETDTATDSNTSQHNTITGENSVSDTETDALLPSLFDEKSSSETSDGVTSVPSASMPGVADDAAISNTAAADPTTDPQVSPQTAAEISAKPTTRQALEQAIENMHNRPMDPKTYNALFSYKNKLQHANTTQKLLEQKRSTLKQQEASNASDAEIQRTQADIAKLEDILAQQEQKLSQAEEDPTLQAAAEKASAKIVKNSRKNDVDFSRTFDRIKEDPLESSTDATPHSDVVKIKCRNEGLDGQKHPVTGVTFKRKQINLFGKQTEVVVPQFESLFDALLPENMLTLSNRLQFKECTRQLKEQIDQNSELRSNFSQKQLDDIAKLKTPSKYTWHHEAETGQMKLVDRHIHQKTGHTGGRHFWGH